jgi:hypothetical protein
MSSLLSENERIRAWNDHLRKSHRSGMVVISRGIAALDRSVWAKIIIAVADFDSFTPENDPYGEHDGAIIDVEGLSVIWKIDYFDETLLHHSDDPGNPMVTKRVMTIMLGEEY